MRLDIDDQVPTQLNNRCLFAIKFSRSVANLFTQLNCDPTECKTRLYKTIPYANNAIQAPAMLHQLCNRASYANTCSSCYAAPIMQSTCYAKHLLLMQSSSSKLPANEPLLSDTPTKMI